MFLAADFVSFILMLKKKKEGRFSGIDKDLGMRNRDGQARKKSYMEQNSLVNIVMET